jgi:hypothetical protein
MIQLIKNIPVILLFIITADVLFAQSILQIEKKNDNYGLVSPDEKFVVKPIYKAIINYSDRNFFLCAKSDGKITFAHAVTGQTIPTKEQYYYPLIDYSYNYWGNMQPNKHNREWIEVSRLVDNKFQRGYLDADFNEVFPCSFEELKATVPLKLILAKKNNLWGIYHRNGQLIAAHKFDNADISGKLFFVGDSTIQVREKGAKEYYSINFDGTLNLGATAVGMTYYNSPVLARMLLLANEKLLTASDKVVLGHLYSNVGLPDSLINLPVSYKWYLEAYNESKSELTMSKLATFIVLHRDFMSNRNDVSITHLYEQLATINPCYYENLGDLYYWGSIVPANQDLSREYYQKLIDTQPTENMWTRNGYIGLSKVYKQMGNKEMSVSMMDKATVIGIRINNPVSDYHFDAVGFSLARNLKYGDVVLYKGHKAMVVSTQMSTGIKLSNNTFMPFNEANFKILNESNASFFTPCTYCRSSGMISREYQSGSITTTSTSTYSGSTITGDYVKTTSTTIPTTVVREEMCPVCNGMKKMVKPY